MFAMNMPLKDEIPWGSGNRFEKQYIEDCLDKADETLAQGFFIAEKVVLPCEQLEVLDLGCGIGTHISAFAQSGFDCTGVDISPFSTKYANEIAILQNTAVSVINDDFMNPAIFTQSAMITCLNDTLGLLSDDEADNFISLIFDNLIAQGLFILSGTNREQIVEKMSFKIGSGKKWEEKNGLMSCRTEFFDFLNGRYNITHEFMDMKTGEKISEPISSVRFYTLSEINNLLENNGFSIESIFGDYEGGEYTAISPHMIIFARKP